MTNGLQVGARYSAKPNAVNKACGLTADSEITIYLVKDEKVSFKINKIAQFYTIDVVTSLANFSAFFIEENRQNMSNSKDGMTKHFTKVYPDYILEKTGNKVTL